MSSGASPAAAPRVAMIVANSVTRDTRVRKMATTVAALGYDVTVLGVSDGRRETIDLDGIRVVRLPTQTVLRDATNERRWLYFSRPQYVVARQRVVVRERELAVAHHLDRSDGVVGTLGRLRRRLRRLQLAARRRWVDRRYAAGQAPRRGLRCVLTPSDGDRLRGQLGDWELMFGLELDDLAPEVIHVHDIQLLGVGVRAKLRAEDQGRRVALIYDAHEYVRGITHLSDDQLEVYREVEDRHLRVADAVVTVSPMIADWLTADHDLPEGRVRLVLNAPELAWAQRDHEHLSIREALGLGDHVTLVVYSGKQSAARGVPDLVDALAHLPDVHLALVAGPTDNFAASEQRRAAAAGYGDRVHVAPFVAPDAVPAYLRTADIGIMPLRHTPNHDASLPNKLFEYLHAGLPIVTSDVPLASQWVTRHGLGQVFTAERPDELAAAIVAVRDHLAAHRAAITPALVEEYSWEAQTRTIGEVYTALAPIERSVDPDPDQDATHRRRPRPVGDPARGTDGERWPRHELLTRPIDRRELVIGPANMAGQAHTWATAVRSRTPVGTESVALGRRGGSTLSFAVDRTIPHESWNDRTWQIEQLTRLPERTTHVLAESGLGLLGTLNGGTITGDLGFLRANRIDVAVVCHGSEIRDPRRHAGLERFSPFADPLDDTTARLQRATERTAAQLRSFDGPVFVTTLDLFDDLPDAVWLPTCLDLDVWVPGDPPAFDRPPRVLHAPTNTRLKGSEYVDPLLQRLDAEGLISYDRVSGIPHAEMPARVAAADIVLDQFVIGHYCHFSIEAMATGRVVLANVSARVRDRLDDEIPVVQADPDSLEHVLRSMLADPADALATARRGPGFVRRYHDGTLSAIQLLAWLRGEPTVAVPHWPR